MNKTPQNERDAIRFSTLPCKLIVGDSEFVIEAKNYLELNLQILKFASSLSETVLGKKVNNKMNPQEPYSKSDNIEAVK